MNRISFICLLIFAAIILALPATSSAQVSVGVSVRIGPPALPIYAQPVCPGAGYIWTPGYWAWGSAGYYWVPGTWVVAPRPGLLWTPGYWGWSGGLYLWHGGYWGPRVGFYGGVNYGFGYGGVGFAGGYWNRGVFLYNRSVTNVNVTVVHNVYNRTVVVNNSSHVAFNGGPGGLAARPTPDEEAAGREQHFQPTAMQMNHQRAAGNNRALWASENHGRPSIAATARPGDFDHGVVAAREGGPANRNADNRSGFHNFSNGNNENRNASRPQNNERPQHANNPPRGENRKQSHPLKEENRNNRDNHH